MSDVYGFVSPECEGAGNHQNGLCQACNACYKQFVRRCRAKADSRRDSDPSKIDHTKIQYQSSPTDLKRGSRAKADTVQKLRVKLRSAQQMILALKKELEIADELELAPELSQRLGIKHVVDLFEEGSANKVGELMQGETATRKEVALTLYRDLEKNARVAKQSGKTAIQIKPLLLKWCIDLYCNCKLGYAQTRRIPMTR